MAVMMIMEAPEGTTEEYDRTNEIMGLHGDEDAPDGLVHHVAASDGNGLVIVDVWESEEAFGRFYEQRLGPALEQSGVASSAGEPRPPLPVHNALAGKGAEANVLILIDVDGLGTDEYDQMASRMESHQGDGSNGPWVTHTAAKRDGGMVVADVWDSAEAFGKFGEEQIGPAGAAVGLGPIEPRIVPVYNRIRGRARVS
jgi:heme-degrading monooxygenase HmoA